MTLHPEDVIDVDVRLAVVAEAGELLLSNGAATYRVEETMRFMGLALGLPEIEIVATPTGFTIQAAGPSHTVTRVRRVTRMGVNMNRLAEINRLSRDLHERNTDLAEIARRLRVIREQGVSYPVWLVVGGVTLACGAFCLLLGGGWQELAATLLGALLAMLTRISVRRWRLLPMMVTVLAAFAATVGSWAGCRALACTAPGLAPVAAVLQLVPGVPLVTSVIDLATGDITSGLVRGAYAATIIAGVALGMLLWLAWGFGL